MLLKIGEADGFVIGRISLVSVFIPRQAGQFCRLWRGRRHNLGNADGALRRGQRSTILGELLATRLGAHCDVERALGVARLDAWRHLAENFAGSGCSDARIHFLGNVTAHGKDVVSVHLLAEFVEIPFGVGRVVLLKRGQQGGLVPVAGQLARLCFLPLC